MIGRPDDGGAAEFSILALPVRHQKLVRPFDAAATSRCAFFGV
jgi:hypothetical protein